MDEESKVQGYEGERREEGENRARVYYTVCPLDRATQPLARRSINVAPYRTQLLYFLVQRV